MKKTVFILLSIVLSALSYGNDGNQKKLSKQEYIELYKENAIKSMQAFKIPASITMAQAILESGSGNSELAQKANNHFGIKCHKEWDGKKVFHDDDSKNECFRKYQTVYESFEDHSKFLTTRDRYSFLFSLDISDYKEWAHGLKKAGYATNPKYAQLLIKIIEENNLQELDKAVLTGVQVSAVKQVESAEETSVKSAASLAFEDLPEINNVKYVIAGPDDSYLGLARKYEMMLWQIHKYNDSDKNSDLEPGSRVFLKPKKSRSKKEYHTAQQGETMHDISQQYAVKLKKLYKYNDMNPGDKPVSGSKIKLRR